MNNRVVLVIDDYEPQMQMMVLALRQAGYETDSALDGRRALARCEQQEPAVIILDLLLPGMYGMDVLMEVRQRWPDVAIIIVTGVSNEERAIAALNFGAFGYIRKPFRVPELVSHVERALATRHAVLALRESEERYRALYGVLLQVVEMLTAHLQIVYDYNARNT